MVLSEDINGSDIYYALHYSKDYRKDDAAFALFDCVGNVAMLIVDEFMIEIFNGEEAAHSDEVLWGMNFKCEVPKLNDGVKPENIGLFPVEIYRQINNYIMLQLVRRIDFRGRFNAMHMQLFGCEMPVFIFEEVMNEVYKAKLADMYTFPNYVKAMKRVIQAHPEMYRKRFSE